ncbi:PREDICTED: serine/threonine-protein phosphatase 6 regulatory subunit 3-like [Amphimedon queenslandica]|uniref:Uncharacterized protein n=1 Tax=Amphimedon queenslandica TaxID=400682 RepID=A0A1X7VP31_AMPQE|nr:PREDICTED: serine/threonine-protein phosphatase 6 regulatory subunit 3-like [Amphimedon queenslandica]|eukprot:XP_019861189.1 PREDICTED: serine/threonine-protein phosphatase 6 regulatory subunit 3-like [Amphimedon queenslandica]
MFWKINFRPTSAIDGLLDKEDCTLNEILDEDDVLQEVKSQNKKLVEFLQKEDNLETLVKYACVVSEPDLEDKYKFKYPHLACEILTADVFTIVEGLATAEKFLPMLWKFLHDEPPLNPLIASFNSKILAMLLGQRTTLFLEYIQKIEGFVDHFLKHLGTSAIMDLLLQMIAAPEGDQGRQDVAMWLSDEGVIEKLIDFVTTSSSVDQCVNSSQALCDILRISRESAQMSGPGPLLKTLENEETIKRLLDNMFSVDDPPDWVIINGTYVLLTALEKRNYGSGYSPTFSRSYPQSGATGGGGEEALPVDQSTEKIITNIVPCVKLFHNLLNRKPQCETMVTTVGVLDPPLGNMRLQVVRLFSALLYSHDTRIQKEIILNSTLTVLLDLFFQYPWNNFLHTQVESCIIAGLASVSPVTMEMDNGTGQPNNTTTLRQHLLSDSKLVQRLLDGARTNQELIGSSEIDGTRLGFMGHLVRMANQISGNDRLGNMGGVLERAREEAATTTATVDDERLQGELDRDTYEKWTEFISGPIAEMNKKNDTNLGGSRALTSSIDDSDEEFDPLNMGPDNEFEKAFQQYQDSRFSTILIEDFGLNDGLDPAPVSYSNTYTALTSINCTVEADEVHTQLMAGFEACCSERIHPFDDTDSEDEEESSPWAEKEISFVSSLGQRSLISTSEEDDEDETNKEKGRRREFPTESSDDEDSLKLMGGKDRLIIVEGKERNSEPNEIGVISWKSEFSTDEDLSRPDPNDWTQEPAPATTGGGGGGADEKNWADFSTFSTGQVKEDTVVSVTYVSVKELESESASTSVVTSSASIQVSGEGGVSGRVDQYTRISSTGSIGSVGSEEDMILDNNLLQSNEREEEEEEGGADSDHSSGNNSSDEDRSVNYGVTDGDSGNPLLLNESSDVSIEETETTPTNNEEKIIEGVVTESSNS